MTGATAGALAHRNVISPTYNLERTYNVRRVYYSTPYGVPACRRLLTAGIFNKKFDLIRDYLQSLGLTLCERQIAMNLIRLYCYYGLVYPKATLFTEERGCSRRTFWRAVAKLEELGLLDRINRYLHHLQISNAYRLDKLILILARYLSEHGYSFTDNFTRILLRLTDNSFWRKIWSIKVRLRDPKPLISVS